MRLIAHNTVLVQCWCSLPGILVKLKRQQKNLSWQRNFFWIAAKKGKFSKYINSKPNWLNYLSSYTRYFVSLIQLCPFAYLAWGDSSNFWNFFWGSVLFVDFDVSCVFGRAFFAICLFLNALWLHQVTSIYKPLLLLKVSAAYYLFWSSCLRFFTLYYSSPFHFSYIFLFLLCMWIFFLWISHKKVPS